MGTSVFNTEIVFSVTWKYIAFLSIILCVIPTYCSDNTYYGSDFFTNQNSKISRGPGERCFCKLEGRIDDCTCSVDTVDYFNNNKIYPRLKSLLVRNYFRYFKVNLNRGCPFWPDDSRCAIKDCSVKTCSEEKIPPGIKKLSIGERNKNTANKSLNKYSREAQEEDNCDENHGGLGAVDETISEKSKEDFKQWQKHDDSQDIFCEIEDESSQGMQYVDLLINPERYTGYKGLSACRIWRSIYEENCFKPGKGYGPYTTSKNLNAMCLEKRAFYRAISGLHTSINIHLCAQYLMPVKNSFGSGEWNINLKEFQRRFDPQHTSGEGPQWLKNLYFVYLLELRALAKAAPYLERELFYTGLDEEDKEVQVAVKDFLSVVKSFPDHFQESVMFVGRDEGAKKLKEEFRQHFRNISRIMDCVGCDKCRLWGKLQTQGLGTAMKILFSGDQDSDLHMSDVKKEKFQLTRIEIVSLFNAFGRLSNSVYQLENFRKMMKEL
ncbi:ERO1-like protein beta isoform X1 [Tachypleus tridentatus]|uniref:ERO1-like protein beta isoform X1 n=1 Tax=Tachypleus tridentatus TaxID=6853 RepID=UPI003FD13C16